MRCNIITGGEHDTLSGAGNCELLIACDRGVLYTLWAGLTPHLIVGDFDSYTGPLPRKVSCIRLPKEKDDTDTMYAVKFALEQGCDSITLYCALGGRLDHLLGNLQTLLFAAKAGAGAAIIGQGCRIDVLAGKKLTLPPQKGHFSVLSLSDESTVSIRNAKYQIDSAQLVNSFPLGISNEWVGGDVEVEVSSGAAAVIRVSAD